jgi:integrase/recombinase XerD
MSKDHSPQEDLERIGEITGRESDPLEKHNSVLEKVREDGIDPFEVFLDDIKLDSVKESTADEYRRSFRHFREFMSSNDRHPACANTSHVVGFAHNELKKGNKKSTIENKIEKLDVAFGYFQRETRFPHGSEYNPFKQAKEKISWPDEKEEELPDISQKELRSILSNITHIRNRIIVLLGFKFGMRQGEIRNMQLQDIHINNDDLKEHYDEMGTHERIEGHKNVIYIPSQYQREGNKSERGRLLPLDREVRRALVDYLLIRPDCGQPWVFVSQTDHEHITDKNRLNQVWREDIASQVETKDYHRSIRSHYGRHWFTSYWTVKQDINRELVKYMRGDKTGRSFNPEAIDEYIHAYYQDIEEIYVNNIFKLNI